MSLVALRPELLDRLFSENPNTTPDGKYIVLLYKNGGWRRIRVDDSLPTYGRHPPQLLFVRSKGGDELWPSILEKAYAAVSNNSYTSQIWVHHTTAIFFFSHHSSDHR